MSSPSSRGIITSSTTRVGRPGLDRGEGLETVGGEVDLVALEHESPPERRLDRRLVVHHEDAHPHSLAPPHEKRLNPVRRTADTGRVRRALLSRLPVTMGLGLLAAALAAGPALAAHEAPGQRAKAKVRRSIPLPATSPWALPPILVLHTRTGASAPAAELRRRVLHSPKLLLSPAARRAIVRGQAAPGALDLLLHVPRTGSPLLVFQAEGAGLRVQETTFSATRLALEGLDALPVTARPAQLRMRQMSASTYQVAAPRGGMLGAQAVAIARQYLGIPYVWGGASPVGGFDCSGLVMFVYAKLGVHLDHYAAFQFHEGTPVAPGDLQPGDLVFFEPTASGPGHVGMYIGGTEFIQAPHTGDVVKISSLTEPFYRSEFVGAVRPS